MTLMAPWINRAAPLPATVLPGMNTWGRGAAGFSTTLLSGCGCGLIPDLSPRYTLIEWSGVAKNTLRENDVSAVASRFLDRHNLATVSAPLTKLTRFLPSLRAIRPEFDFLDGKRILVDLPSCSVRLDAYA